MKRVILCADDFGISPGVNQGIIRLAEKERISATSAMVVYDEWPSNAKILREFKNRIDIGLHFVLTESRPLSPLNEIPSLINSSTEETLITSSISLTSLLLGPICLSEKLYVFTSIQKIYLE